ncbi:hypothetical protein ACHAPU_011402 [Fusarium lateritium]
MENRQPSRKRKAQNGATKKPEARQNNTSDRQQTTRGLECGDYGAKDHASVDCSSSDETVAPRAQGRSGHLLSEEAYEQHTLGSYGLRDEIEGREEDRCTVRDKAEAREEEFRTLRQENRRLQLQLRASQDENRDLQDKLRRHEDPVYHSNVQQEQIMLERQKFRDFVVEQEHHIASLRATFDS